MSGPANYLYEFHPFLLDPVRRQLLRDGRALPLTSKAFETLLALVENRGRVLEKRELMNRVWPDTAVEENNLNQCVTALRKTLGDSPQERSYIVTVPGRGYSFVASVRQVPAAEQVAREPMAGQEEPVASTSSRPLWTQGRKALALSAAAVVVVSLLLFLWIREHGWGIGLAPPVRSIAVLPFRSLVPTGESEEYLGLGIADALINRLSNIRQAVVRPTSAVARYTDPRVDPVAAGRELQVDSVLEGTIQRSGDRIRLTVRLLRVRDGGALWAERLDTRFTDIFAVQDSVSDQVVQALKLELSDEERSRLARRHTRSPEAYQAYLKGRYYWAKGTGEGLRRAVEYFQQAIEKDPGYALAYAGLADCYVFGGGLAQPLSERYPKARAAATKALELDDTLAEAYAPLAYIQMSYEWDWSGALKGFRRAIELNAGHATAHQYYAECLAFLGRMEEAAAEIKKAQDLDPLSPAINTAAARIFYYGRAYDRAIAECRKALEIDAGFVQAHVMVGRAYEQKRMFDPAIAAFQKALDLGRDRPGTLASLGHAYAISGRQPEARRIVEELQQLSAERYVSPFLLATLYAGLGEKDRAFASLETARQTREGALRTVKVDPRLDGLHSDRRFTELLARIGLGQ